MDQVDDVLKSIVVFDDKGNTGFVQLPSRAPLSDIFRGLPFGPAALESNAALIDALKGSEVSVRGPDVDERPHRQRQQGRRQRLPTTKARSRATASA